MHEHNRVEWLVRILISSLTGGHYWRYISLRVFPFYENGVTPNEPFLSFSSPNLYLMRKEIKQQHVSLSQMVSYMQSISGGLKETIYLDNKCIYASFCMIRFISFSLLLLLLLYSSMVKLFVFSFSVPIVYINCARKQAQCLWILWVKVQW